MSDQLVKLNISYSNWLLTLYVCILKLIVRMSTACLKFYLNLFYVEK